MTFTEEVKSECSRLEIDNACCAKAEIAAFLRLNGSLEIGGQGRLGVSITTENPATARRAFRLLKSAAGLETQVFIRRKTRLKKNNTYMISIKPNHQTLFFLAELGMMRQDKSIVAGIAPHLVERECCQRAYLRGCFLASGAVSDPKKGRYHCEILAHDEIHAEDLVKLCVRQDLSFKYIERKTGFVCYLKDSQQITAFLTVIGAHSAALQYESARVFRDMRNRVNRLVNSETANLNKTLTASWRQIRNIKLIEESIGLSSLPKKLREVAEARLKHPELSLKELSEVMGGTLSKSAINHRLRKIERMARDLE